MDWREYIEQRPHVMLGKPVIKDTRPCDRTPLDAVSEGPKDEWDEWDVLTAHLAGESPICRICPINPIL